MFGLNTFITAGIVLWVIGKIAKSGPIEKIGFYCIIGGVVIMALGFLGIGIPFLS